MFEFLNDIGNYESRKVGRDKVGSITVSTVFTSDEVYETALIDSNGVHPVERYETKELAVKGHANWIEKSRMVRIVNKLGGLSGLVDDKFIKIERDSPAA